MLALNDIIDFLLGLLGDEEKAAEFDQDPQGTLARAGLDGVTGQDVRDAQLVMADRGAVSAGGGGGSSGGDDPVREIQHTTKHYHVTESTQTIVNLDDRDTIINDSFNSDDDVTIIDDSFNSSVENDVTAIQDNDTTVIQAEDSFNSSVESSVVNDVTAIQDNDTIVNDNDVIVEDDDTVVTQVVEAEADPEPEPDPEPEADVDAVDAVVV